MPGVQQRMCHRGPRHERSCRYSWLSGISEHCSPRAWLALTMRVLAAFRCGQSRRFCRPSQVIQRQAGWQVAALPPAMPLVTGLVADCLPGVTSTHSLFTGFAYSIRSLHSQHTASAGPRTLTTRVANETGWGRRKGEGPVMTRFTTTLAALRFAGATLRLSVSLLRFSRNSTVLVAY